MKRLFLVLALITSFALPQTAGAAATYTCASSEGTLEPLTVKDPNGADASKVSAFISTCSAANGTASGPREGASCTDGGTWATVQSEMVCQSKTITKSNQLSDKCLNAGSDTTQCNAAENAYIQSQGTAYQNDPTKVPMDATARERLYQQQQAEAYAQLTRTTSVNPSTANKFCQGGVCTYTPLEPLPVGDGGQSGRDFGAFMSAVFRVLITFGGLFAVVMLTVAGIGYMLSESALDIDKAKDRAKAALWGLLLLVGSWLILNTINPNLLRFDLLRSTVQTLSNSVGAPVSPSGANAVNATAPDQNAKNACEAQVGAYKQKSDGSWGCTYAGQF